MKFIHEGKGAFGESDWALMRAFSSGEKPVSLSRSSRTARRSLLRLGFGRTISRSGLVRVAENLIFWALISKL